MPAPHSAIAPERLGRYELLTHLARGGMAELHLARSTGIEGFEKLVVIKTILPELARHGEMVRMFLDEARIAATLHHSNIVQVYDFGESAGRYYLAMEFLHGQDVRRLQKALLSRGRTLPLEHALAIALGVCAGLHYAHEQVGLDGQHLGLVHRDVSPHNIFVTYDGGVKVLDFGIAKAARTHATTQGSLKGKIRYMSPEQCRSQPLDRRSDIFSVGIVLWELTAGRRLYRGPDFDVLKAIVERDAPPPSRYVEGYPPELEAIVMRALRRDRERRWQTAEELYQALETFAREHKLPVSPVALGRLTRELFADKMDAWQQAIRTNQVDKIADTMRIELLPDEDEESPNSLSVPPTVVPPPRRRNSLLLAAGAAAVTLTLALAWPRSRPVPSAQAIAPPLAVPAPVAKAPAAPSTPEPEPPPPPSPEPPRPRRVAIKHSAPPHKKPRPRPASAPPAKKTVDPDAPLPP